MSIFITEQASFKSMKNLRHGFAWKEQIFCDDFIAVDTFTTVKFPLIFFKLLKYNYNS